MPRNANIDWNTCAAKPNTWDIVQVDVLMDIRQELQLSNQLLRRCEAELICNRRQLIEIRRQTKKRKYVRQKV